MYLIILYKLYNQQNKYHQGMVCQTSATSRILLITIVCLICILQSAQSTDIITDSSSSLLSLSQSQYMPTAQTFYSFNDTRFQYYGRYYSDTSGLRYDWSCFTIKFCIQGNVQQVYWAGSDGFGHYKVVNHKDNTQKLMIPKKSNKVKIYQSTSSASQINVCLSIVKITQDHYGPLGTHKDALFKGIYINGGPNAQLYKPDYNYKYKLQFVGDSLTSAFGDMSGSNPICFLRMRHNQNCMQSWAVHLSNKLNAQYRIQAQSGKGVVKNQIGVTGQVMPILFTKTTSNSVPNSYHYQDKYTPDAIIFSLGANDYTNPIKPFKNIFIFGYQKMLTDAAKLIIQNTGHYPKIIGVCFDDFPGHECDYVKQAVTSFSYSYKQVYYVTVSKGAWAKGNAGCIGHPNVKGQKFIAESLYEQVKNILENGKV